MQPNYDENILGINVIISQQTLKLSFAGNAITPRYPNFPTITFAT